MWTSPPIFAAACDSDSANHNPECERCCCADASHSVMIHLSVSQILVWTKMTTKLEKLFGFCGFTVKVQRINFDWNKCSVCCPLKRKSQIYFKFHWNIRIFSSNEPNSNWPESLCAYFPIGFNQNFSVWEKKSKRKKADFLTVIRRTWCRCQMSTRRVWPWAHDQMLLRMI